MPSAIVANKLDFCYPRMAEPSISDVSFRVESGAVVGVLGPNGSGKTTLMNLITGNLCPQGGEVLLFGKDVRRLPRREAARLAAVVPASLNINFSYLVSEIVMMGRSPHVGSLGMMNEADHEIVQTEMQACDVWKLRNRRFSELSAGEKKRVIVARALAQRAKLILLDEPTAFLDIHHQIASLELLVERAGQLNVTVLLILHDLNLAAQYCERLLLLRQGVCVADGSVEEVMTYRTICQAFGTDVYVGINEINKKRFFVPMRYPQKSD